MGAVLIVPSDGSLLGAARVRQRSAQEELLEREVQRAKMEATTAQMIEESKRKDEFLAILAHELRNPLAPVVYALDLANIAKYPGADMTVERIGDLADLDISHLPGVMPGAPPVAIR